MMDWVYLAAGATGALTLVFVCRQTLGRLLGGPGVRSWFTPADNPLAALLRSLQAARREILVQAGTFTAPELAQALVAAKQRKVTVEILLAPSQERDPASVLPFLLDQGLAPLIDHEHRDSRPLIVIVDERVVFTGSLPLGPTESVEHLIELQDQPGAAPAFRQQFFLRREQGRPPQLRSRTVATPTPTPVATPTPTPAPTSTPVPVRTPTPVPVPAQTQTPTPTTPPATPPISETLARLLPGLRGVNLPSEADLDAEESEQRPAA